MDLRTFDLNLLRVLRALLETHSTTRAGQMIGLSQPAVSAALGRLREHLKDPLFVRIGPRLEPTDYALTLSEPLRRILDQTEAILSGPPAFDPLEAQDSFRVSGSDFFSELLMPDLAAFLCRTAPGVRVQMVDLMPGQHGGKLESHEIDLALAPHFEIPGWMDWQPIFESPMVMVARGDHPCLDGLLPSSALDLETYCTLGHILFSPEGNYAGTGDTALSRIGKTRRVVMSLPVMHGVCSTVAKTDHLALIPLQMAVKMAATHGLAIRPAPMPIEVPLVGMSWHRKHTTAPAHQWLRDSIADLMSALDQPGRVLPL